MSVGSVGSTSGVDPVRKQAPEPVSKPPPGVVPSDKVSISPAAKEVAAGGDRDHDGDRR